MPAPSYNPTRATLLPAGHAKVAAYVAQKATWRSFREQNIVAEATRRTEASHGKEPIRRASEHPSDSYPDHRSIADAYAFIRWNKAYVANLNAVRAEYAL